MNHEIIISENKDWIAEVTDRYTENKPTTVTLQPVGGNFSIYFGDDFKAFKEFISGLPDG